MIENVTQPVQNQKTAISENGFLLDCWYLAAPSKYIKAGQQKRIEMLDQPVLVGRTKDGTAYALRDICPHRLAPLSAGRQIETAGETRIECPYHGWQFGLDGQCKLIPSLVDGQDFKTERIHITRYHVEERYGGLFVYIPRDVREPTISEYHLPELGKDIKKPKFIISRVFNAHMDNAVVGLMDPAHVPFIHSQWWWRPPSAGFKQKEKAFIPIDRGWAIERHTPSGNSLAYRALFGAQVTTQILFQIPGYRWEIVEAKNTRLLTLTCLTPHNAGQTMITQMSYWDNAPILDILMPILIPAAKTFLDQDGDIVDLQNTGLQYQKNMLWIDDIDVQAKWYQTLKKEWQASQTEGRKFANPIKARRLRWRS